MLSSRKLIVLLGAAALGVGLGAGLGYEPLLNYKTEGVLSMEMGTAEYKRFAELANDATSIGQYIDAVPPGNLTSTERAGLIASVVSGRWQKPVPKVSKADAKELPDILLQMEQDREKALQLELDRDKGLQRSRGPNAPASAYLGVRLNYAGRDPKGVADIAVWLGAYVKDVAAREAIREQVAQWSAENRQFSDRALERKLRFGFDIEQAQTRVGALKTIVAAYPEGGKKDSQQVIDVRRDNEKFLSPLSQLVAAESEIIGIREQTKRLDREIEQQTFIKSLVTDAEAVTRDVKTGSESVIKLSAVINDFSQKVKTDGEREKLLGLTADLSKISARFLSQAQFIARPSIPTQPEKPKPLQAALIGGLLALLAAGLFVWRSAIVDLLRDDPVSKP
jgi:hypothetical protein